MNKILFFLLFCPVIFTQSVYGQQIFSNSQFPEDPVKVALILYSQPSYLLLEEAGYNNGIFITQVGDENTIKTDFSGQSAVVLKQIGQNNYLEINLDMKSIGGTLVQNGHGNFFFNSAHEPNREIFLNVRQNGNHHHFESHGSNSIGNKIHFNMSGDSQAVIVRNFQ